MKKSCFVSFASGSYVDYIPFYIRSLRVVYPECDIKVFVIEDIKGDLWKKLFKHGYNKYIVKCLDLVDFVKILSGFKRKKRAQIIKSLRWLINPSYFRVYDYIYVGDIDMVFYPMGEHIFDYHIRHMKATGLPYSNKVREGTNRMTGIHFIDVKEYFNKVSKRIGILKEEILNGECDFDFGKKGANEILLHDLIKLSGVGIKYNEKWHRETGSIHIGQSRIKKVKELGKLPIQAKEFFKNLYENDIIFNDLMQGNSRSGELDLIHKLFCDE